MKVYLRNAEEQGQLSEQQNNVIYNAIENSLMSKNFPHLRLLEEIDAQNKLTKNVQLEHQEYVFPPQKKRRSYTCSRYFKTIIETV